MILVGITLLPCLVATVIAVTLVGGDRAGVVLLAVEGAMILSASILVLSRLGGPTEIGPSVGAVAGSVCARAGTAHRIGDPREHPAVRAGP